MQRENSLKTKKAMNNMHRSPLSPSANNTINGMKCPKIMPSNKMQQENGDLTPKDIFGMIMGFQQTQILVTASTLGVFDEIQRSGEPVSAATVASHVRTNLDSTERLMNACAAMKLLHKEVDGKGKALYTNAPMTNMLVCKSSPMSLRPFLNNISDIYSLWGKLPTGVREGSAAIQKPDLFGEENGYYCNNGKRQMDFLSAMNYFSKMDAPQVTKAFDLNEFDSICDLGGGTGALAVAMGTGYPHTHVTVMELSHMVNVAQHFMVENKPPNVSFHSGDFFKDCLPPADLYVLSHVIHDWDKDKVEILLKRVYRSLQPGGAVLILEKMLSESKDGPLPTLMFDIGMMLGANGRERSFSEYEELLTDCGFEKSDIQLKVLPPTVYKDAILARK